MAQEGKRQYNVYSENEPWNNMSACFQDKIIKKNDSTNETLTNTQKWCLFKDNLYICP